MQSKSFLEHWHGRNIFKWDQGNRKSQTILKDPSVNNMLREAAILFCSGVGIIERISERNAYYTLLMFEIHQINDKEYRC